MNDLSIIKNIERDCGVELKEVPYDVAHYGYDYRNSWTFHKKQIPNSGGSILYGNRMYSLNSKGDLIALSLDYLPISNFDYSMLTKLGFLEFLSLRNWNVDIFELSRLKYLKKLDLSMCLLKNTAQLQHLKELVSLDLGYTEISEITFLKSLKKLEVLDLGYNKISNISTLSELENIEILDLSDNEIHDISSLIGLKDIRRLRLFGNPIKYIPYFENVNGFEGLGVDDELEKVLDEQYDKYLYPPTKDEENEKVSFLSKIRSYIYKRNKNPKMLAVL